MLDAAILDVAIGLILVYLTLGLVCTAIGEVINSALALRADNLRAAIHNLLDSDDAAQRFYAHPLIRTLRRADTYPSWIPTDRFARAFIDLALAGPDTPRTVEALRERLATAESGLPELPRQAALALLEDGVTTLEQARERIGGWFDESMERAAGWYRRRIQRWTLGASLALVTLLDVDTLEIAQATWTNDELRAGLVHRAERLTEDAAREGRQIRMQAEDIAKEIEDLRAGHMPLGWTAADVDRLATPGAPGLLAIVGKVAGLLASAFAVSLGAPFWFDLLNRVMKARAAVTARTPETTP